MGTHGILLFVIDWDSICRCHSSLAEVGILCFVCAGYDCAAHKSIFTHFSWHCFFGFVGAGYYVWLASAWWRKQSMVVFEMKPAPNKSPEPTAVGAVSSAVAVHVASRRWLSFLR